MFPWFHNVYVCKKPCINKVSEQTFLLLSKQALVEPCQAPADAGQQRAWTSEWCLTRVAAAVWDTSPLEKCLFEKNSQAENCSSVWPLWARKLWEPRCRKHISRGSKVYFLSSFMCGAGAVRAEVDNAGFLCKRTDERNNRHFHEVSL